MEDELIKLRDQIEFYKANDNMYIEQESKSGEKIRTLIKYDDHMMRILDMEIGIYAKNFEKDENEKDIITYILLIIYSLLTSPMLLNFNKFIRYLEKNRELIENSEELMSKIAILFKLLDSNRIIDRKEILSFLSEGYKNFAENDKISDIYINVMPKETVIRLIDQEEVADEIDNLLRYLIYTENERNTAYRKDKLNLKIYSGEEEKTLVL